MLHASLSVFTGYLLRISREKGDENRDKWLNPSAQKQVSLLLIIRYIDLAPNSNWPLINNSEVGSETFEWVFLILLFESDERKSVSRSSPS
jgi:hypothetical protein